MRSILDPLGWALGWLGDGLGMGLIPKRTAGRFQCVSNGSLILWTSGTGAGRFVDDDGWMLVWSFMDWLIDGLSWGIMATNLMVQSWHDG